LLDRNNLLHEWCNPIAIKRLIEKNRRGFLGSEHHLYKLVSTQVWISKCIEQAEF
jgi:hypothetical protein